MLQNRYPRLAAAFLLASAAAFAQTAPAQPAAAPAAAPLAFEVASVKLAPPLDIMAIASGKAHIGMNVDKARVDIGGLTLLQLVCVAYKVKPYQVAGNPEWMNVGLNADRFDILAKMPEGANKDQVPDMLQSLLAERFQLKLHHDTRDTPVYALVVGKGGPKMKEAPPDDPPAPADTASNQPAAGGSVSSAAPPPAQESKPADAKAAAPAKGEMSFGSGDNKVTMKQSGNGMVINSKETGPMRMSPGENGSWRLEGDKMSMEMLTAMLSQYLDRPVVDQTELKGKYHVAIEMSMDTLMAVARKAGVNMGMAGMPAAGGKAGNPADAASDPSGSSLFTSVQQLGLKLEPRKLPYDYLVIDHVEKAPTEN
jgi:uncharacterized protein (TIGR03435 family)